MAFMYARHFADVPIFWDDPSWTSDEEAAYLEAKIIFKKPAVPMEDKGEDLLFGSTSQVDGLQAPNNNSGVSGPIADPEDDDDDDDAMDDA